MLSWHTDLFTNSFTLGHVVDCDCLVCTGLNASKRRVQSEHAECQARLSRSTHLIKPPHHSHNTIHLHTDNSAVHSLSTSPLSVCKTGKCIPLLTEWVTHDSSYLDLIRDFSVSALLCWSAVLQQNATLLCYKLSPFCWHTESRKLDHLFTATFAHFHPCELKREQTFCVMCSKIKHICLNTSEVSSNFKMCCWTYTPHRSSGLRSKPSNIISTIALQ